MSDEQNPAPEQEEPAEPETEASTTAKADEEANDLFGASDDGEAEAEGEDGQDAAEANAARHVAFAQNMLDQFPPKDEDEIPVVSQLQVFRLVQSSGDFYRTEPPEIEQRLIKGMTCHISGSNITELSPPLPKYFKITGGTESTQVAKVDQDGEITFWAPIAALEDFPTLEPEETVKKRPRLKTMAILGVVFAGALAVLAWSDYKKDPEGGYTRQGIDLAGEKLAVAKGWWASVDLTSDETQTAQAPKDETTEVSVTPTEPDDGNSDQADATSDAPDTSAEESVAEEHPVKEPPTEDPPAEESSTVEPPAEESLIAQAEIEEPTEETPAQEQPLNSTLVEKPEVEDAGEARIEDEPEQAGEEPAQQLTLAQVKEANAKLITGEKATSFRVTGVRVDAEREAFVVHYFPPRNNQALLLKSVYVYVHTYINHTGNADYEILEGLFSRGYKLVLDEKSGRVILEIDVSCLESLKKVFPHKSGWKVIFRHHDIIGSKKAEAETQAEAAAKAKAKAAEEAEAQRKADEAAAKAAEEAEAKRKTDEEAEKVRAEEAEAKRKADEAAAEAEAQRKADEAAAKAAEEAEAQRKADEAATKAAEEAEAKRKADEEAEKVRAEEAEAAAKAKAEADAEAKRKADEEAEAAAKADAEEDYKWHLRYRGAEEYKDPANRLTTEEKASIRTKLRAQFRVEEVEALRLADEELAAEKEADRLAEEEAAAKAKAEAEAKAEAKAQRKAEERAAAEREAGERPYKDTNLTTTLFNKKRKDPEGLAHFVIRAVKTKDKKLFIDCFYGKEEVKKLPQKVQKATLAKVNRYRSEAWKNLMARRSELLYLKAFKKVVAPLDTAGDNVWRGKIIYTYKGEDLEIPLFHLVKVEDGTWKVYQMYSSPETPAPEDEEKDE